MPSSEGPDVWHLIFEQTPPVLRWVLGILTLGIFTVLGILYRWSREDLRRVESRITHLEGRLDRHMDENNRLLTQIASNTGGR